MSRNLLLIGLINNDNKQLGDTKHFNRLVRYFKDKVINDVYTISISERKNKEGRDYFIRYPKNRYARALYWNIWLTILSLHIILNHHISLVYIRFNSTAILLPFCLKLFGISYGFEINGVNNVSKGVLFKIHKYIISGAKFIVAAPGYAKHVKNKYNPQNARICSASLGYNFGKRKNYNLDKVSKDLKLDLSKFYYIFIGNIRKYQGLSFILEAIGKYKARLPNKVHFLIIGDGPFEKELKKIVDRFNISDVVDFVPRQTKDDLDKYLSLKQAVGLSPFSPNRGSIGSISGLKTFDYISHEMPILTSRMDEKADMIKNDGIGWVIESFRNKDVMNLILKAYKEFDGAKKAYSNLLTKYQSQFTWENRFGKIEKQIQQELK